MHLEPSDAPGDLVAMHADIPDDIARAEVALRGLPPDWRRYPAPQALADLGTQWARVGTTAVLSVPSAVIPPERNYLLNPAHPEFRAIRLGAPAAFSFDPRMWKR